MTTEIKVYKTKYSKRPEIIVHNTEHLSPEGAFMMALVERWGMIMAEDDGEDSAGRQKARIMTVEELVTRAADIAELAFKTVRDKGLTVSAPTVAEIDATEPDDDE